MVTAFITKEILDTMLFLLLQHNRSHNCSRVSEYQQVATYGIKWCKGCIYWHPFTVSISNGLHSPLLTKVLHSILQNFGKYVLLCYPQHVRFWCIIADLQLRLLLFHFCLLKNLKPNRNTFRHPPAHPLSLIW